MLKKILLPMGFLALFLGGVWLHGLSAQQVRKPGTPVALPPAEPGTFPAQWINGVDCASEPVIGVHPYNDDFYILRQSKCANFEAPFMYLIFGEQRALLLDTGAAPSIPLFATVMGVVAAWEAQTGNVLSELIVSHTHNHGDHVQADFQFVGQPGVTFVSAGMSAMQTFFGFTAWPHEVVTFDLGNRILDVIPTPGHQPASLTFYDRRTRLLLTGDIVYPGHLFVFLQDHWQVFKDSIDRLIAFTGPNPVTHIVGCHIEMTDQPGVPFHYGTPAHPDEHVLQLPRSVLFDIRAAADEMGAVPVCAPFDDFVIHPVYVCGF